MVKIVTLKEPIQWGIEKNRGKLLEENEIEKLKIKVWYYIWNQINNDFPGSSDGKASAYNAGDPGSIPGSGRSPGEGNGNPLQYSCLENPMDGEAW